MSITEQVVTIATAFLSAGGYGALLVLTLLDSTVLPVPNEAIMPFAGFLVYTGRFDVIPVLVVSTIGGLIGALTSYAIGYVGALPLIDRYGKWVGIKRDDMQKTHTFFEKHGDSVILISRFIPVVRQFISIPAGAAKMNLTKFCVYTVIGSLVWNSVILGIGYALGANWERFGQYAKYGDVVGIIVVFCVIVLVAYKRRKQKG